MKFWLSNIQNPTKLYLKVFLFEKTLQELRDCKFDIVTIKTLLFKAIS